MDRLIKHPVLHQVENTRVSVAPWYLSGNVPSANCVAAYRAIGATNLAESYINLANPGTYNLTAVFAPTFNKNVGWTFSSGQGQYLNTNLAPPLNPNTWSMLVRFSGATVSCNIAGINNDLIGPNQKFYIGVNNNISFDNRFFKSATVKSVAPNIQSGVLGFSSSAFVNGVNGGALTITNYAGNALNIFIGGTNRGFGSIDSYFVGNIQAVSIYNISLTDGQMASISNSMAALVAS